jgi:thioester reductase-like protein
MKNKSYSPVLDDEEAARVARQLMLIDSRLPDSVNYLGNETPRNHVKKILLIGATGVIGPYLLYQLLQKTKCQMYCFARSALGIEARQRVLDGLEKNHLLELVDTKRITVIEANVAKPKFDLSNEVYQSLAQEIDMVFHNAAWANHLRPYAWPHTIDKSDLRETNIISLREVLLFASIHKTKYVNFTSSVASINRCDFQGRLVEELPSINNLADGLYLGYPQSKFVAEQLLQQAIVKGMPCRIFRLGMVTGDSKTGVQFAENDHNILEIKACTQIGFAPKWDSGRNFLAVDVVAEIMAVLGMDPDILNGAFNIVNPGSVSWSDLIAYLNSEGYSIEMIDEQEWINKLAAVNEDNALYRFKAGYLDGGGMEKTMPAMDKIFHGQVHIGKTLEALANYYIKFPDSLDLFKKHLNYFEQTGFFKKP